MYNNTITHICECIKEKKEISFTISEIKKELYENKIKISEKYKFIGSKLNMPSHTLDYAINDALNAYNACVTNMERNHIKNFRLRKIKFTKKTKVFKLEKLAFKENGFLCSIFGKLMECSVPDYNYRENCITVSIVTKRNNEYYLLSKQIREFKPTKGNHIASIDPGIKTMLTIYSDDGITEIGKDDFIKKKIINANKVTNKKVFERFKEKYLKKLKNSNRTEKFIEERENNINEIIQKKIQKIKNKKYDKIKRQVKDFQWKIANYLTDRFKTILFGNMSTKRTGETKLDKTTKETGKMMGFYSLKEKIKNRCLHKKVNYKEVNEAFTSCICGKCGNHKTDLGCAREYNCSKCKLNTGRDINGARNILIASTRIN